MKESLVLWKSLGLKELLALKESKVLKESLVLKFIYIAETKDIYINISNFTSVCPASCSDFRVSRYTVTALVIICCTEILTRGRKKEKVPFSALGLQAKK